MLTVDTLKANAKLAELSQEQLDIIALLSKNDEQSVIDSRVREIHNRYDADIEKITGQKKPDNVKTYVHLNSVLSDLKGKADNAGDTSKLTSEIDTLKREKADLEKQIKEGSTDTALKSQITALEQKIKDKDDEIKTVKSTYEADKSKYEKDLETERNKMVSLELTQKFDSYLVENGVKFKSTIPDTLLKETLANRKSSLIASAKPDYVDDGKGGKTLVFRNDKGEILRNPENQLNPFTAGELYLKNIGDLVDTGKKQGGGGTGGSGGSGGGSSTLDLSAARSQIQADELIRTHILKNEGITKTDPKFSERHTELRTENKVADLPMREPTA